jgi:hypothetical protein
MAVQSGPSLTVHLQGTLSLQFLLDFQREREREREREIVCDHRTRAEDRHISWYISDISDK